MAYAIESESTHRTPKDNNTISIREFVLDHPEHESVRKSFPIDRETVIEILDNELHRKITDKRYTEPRQREYPVTAPTAKQIIEGRGENPTITGMIMGSGDHIVDVLWDADNQLRITLDLRYSGFVLKD